jgi:predicted dehydrogenase
MDAATRIGFIGAGGVANAHADALAEIDQAEIVAVTDPQAERAEKMAEKTGATVFDSPESLAADAGVDVLFIFVPPNAHGSPEQAALKHKIPFFIEKPVGLDPGQMSEFVKEVERLKLLTSVGYMNRYRKGVQRTRELLAQEPPIMAYGGWWGGSPTADNWWWTDRAKSGGQFHEQVTHTTDLARCFFGEAAEVYAAAANGFNVKPEGYDMDDAATVAIRFHNGGVVNLMSSASSNAGGDIFLNVHSLNRNFHFTGWEHSVTIKTKDEEEPEEIAGEDNIFAVEDIAFFEAVRENDPTKILCTYPDGVKSALISIAANKSVQTGKPVEV